MKRKRGRPPKILPSSSNHPNGQDSVKPVESIAHGSELPEFFKIYVPDLCSNALRIPPDFLKKFEGKFPSVVTLRVLSGLSWQVHTSQVRDEWFLQNGWQDFVVENSIEEGDFMTFCYAGNSVFSVKIYGTNGCLKRNAGMIDVNPYESAEDLEVSESESDDFVAKDMVTGGSSECSTRSKTECRNPSFSVDLKQYNLDRCYLSLPLSFARAHLRHIKRTGARKASKANVTLRYNRKSWEVGFNMREDSHRFLKGWNKFAHDNSLRVGDVCCFEMVDSVDLIFDVSVSR